MKFKRKYIGGTLKAQLELYLQDLNNPAYRNYRLIDTTTGAKAISL